MGASQPKKMGKATRPQIDVACLKARIHLELARDKKNNEIIAKEKELINRLRSNNRNRIEEQLIFEQLVVIYRYAQGTS